MITDPFIRCQTGPERLIEGFYLISRRRANRVDMPVRIWFGAPIDEDGNELDRSPRWQVMVCGVLLDQSIHIGGIAIDTVADIWPACADAPITRDDYDYRIARAAWAAENDPHDPFGSPAGRIDPMTAPLPFL